MRWFIEVSRVGEDTPIEKYCLEAKQWQAALQEARKLRGDSGPLSKFSIELLDNGYRAVDPSQQIRYVVNKAPGDSILSDVPPPGNNVAVGSFPAPAKVPTITTAPLIATQDSGPPTDPMAAPPPSRSDPLASGPKTDPMGAAAIIDGNAAMTTTAKMIPPPEILQAKVTPPPPPSSPKNAKPARPMIVVPEDEVPRAKPRTPSAPPPTTAQPMSSIPSTVAPSTAMPSTQPSAAPPAAPPATAPRAAPTHSHATQRSIEAAREPDFQLIKKRHEEPTEKVPIIYREYAYAVKPGTERKSAEVLLWMRFREVSSTIAERPQQKFIQLAVFDHVFEKKPARPPLATLAWKNWRGDPVVSFPGSSSSPTASGPPPALSDVPPPVSIPRPASQPPPRSANPSVAVAPAPFPPAPSSPEASQRPPAPPEPPPRAPSSGEIDVTFEPESKKQPEPSAAPVPAPVPIPGAPNEVALAVPPTAPPMTREPPTTPSAAPGPPTRRRASEDLIGELFESMHELHFMPDMMAGVRFVSGIIEKTLPSEAVLIHIFDINSRQFVCVRAIGPSPETVILNRTPDSENLFRRAMRSTRATRMLNAGDDESYKEGRWELLGIAPTTAVIAPIQLAGRYLGAIELSNPAGGEPYSENEAHALDYICEQFAEFLAQRPIILDADVVLAKA